MTIYGVAILAACFLIGQLTGATLAYILNIDANVGGVGFAMLLLIFVNQLMRRRNLWSKEAQQGIGFWSALYLPVIVAMSATQNVAVALSAGVVPIAAGILVTIAPLLVLRMITKRGARKNP